MQAAWQVQRRVAPVAPSAPAALARGREGASQTASGLDSAPAPGRGMVELVTRVPPLPQRPDEGAAIVAAAAARDADDDALMARFCAGDDRAFEALHRKYAHQLHAFVRRMVGDRALADDLLQTTFLTVVRARGRYLRGTSVRAWMFAIAANAARDSLRRARVRRLQATQATQESNDRLASAEPPMLPDPPAARAVEEALDALSPDQREAVLLHKVHGLSFSEIAETLGISVGAAKVRAHRGYEHLRVRLAPLGDLT
jgi:RNA polymerase sigma-70 factor (ECF subfamily)